MDSIVALQPDLVVMEAVGKTEQATKVRWPNLTRRLPRASRASRQKAWRASSLRWRMGGGRGSIVSIRMFGQGALVSRLAIQLGLKNAWNGKVDEAWGLGTTDVESVKVGAEIECIGPDARPDGVHGTQPGTQVAWHARGSAPHGRRLIPRSSPHRLIRKGFTFASRVRREW